MKLEALVSTKLDILVKSRDRSFVDNLLKYLFCTLLFYTLQIKGQGQAQPWQSFQDFPSTERDDGISVTINGFAYCGTGLKAGWIPTADLYKYDPITDSWSTLSSLPAGNERQYAAAVSWNNQLFLFGGNRNGTFLNDLWMYDPSLNSWIKLPSLPDTGISGASSFVIGDSLYIMGGSTAVNAAIKSVWGYSLKEQLWKKKSDLPYSAWRGNAAASGNAGFIIFGKDENENHHKDLMKYDSSSDTWTTTSAFPLDGRTYASMVSNDTVLLVFGGMDKSLNYYNDLWCYNINTNIWTEKNIIDSTRPKRRNGVFDRQRLLLYNGH